MPISMILEYFNTIGLWDVAFHLSLCMRLDITLIFVDIIEGWLKRVWQVLNNFFVQVFQNIDDICKIVSQDILRRIYRSLSSKLMPDILIHRLEKILVSINKTMFACHVMMMVMKLKIRCWNYHPMCKNSIWTSLLMINKCAGDFMQGCCAQGLYSLYKLN